RRSTPGVSCASLLASTISRARFHCVGCVITAPSTTSPSRCPCNRYLSISAVTAASIISWLPTSRYPVPERQNGMRAPPRTAMRRVGFGAVSVKAMSVVLVYIGVGDRGDGHVVSFAPRLPFGGRACEKKFLQRCAIERLRAECAFECGREIRFERRQREPTGARLIKSVAGITAAQHAALARRAVADRVGERCGGVRQRHSGVTGFAFVGACQQECERGAHGTLGAGR